MRLNENGKGFSLKTITDYIRAKPLQIIYTVLWGFFVYNIVMAGFSPDPYLINVRNIPPPHPYPTGLVVFLVGAMILQLALLIGLDYYLNSRWKHLFMLIISILFLLYFGMMSMHAPPALTWMIMWQLLSFILLSIVCFIHLVSFILYKVFRRKMPSLKDE